MKLRVAVVSESFLPSTNGVTNSVIRILESLREYGHEAILIAPTAPDSTFLGFHVIRTNRLYFRGFPVGLPLLNLTSILRGFNPDVIHVASPFWLGDEALRVARRIGVPSVAVYQTDVAGYAARYGLKALGKFGHFITKRTLRKASLVLAPTSVMRDKLKAIGVPNVEVWGRGVDFEKFSPANRTLASTLKLRAKLAKSNQTVIGFVGRLAPEKQLHRYGELFGLPNTVFYIVGDGSERSNLEQLFANQPVTFAGELHGHELANAYSAMDIFVHCGTEETFGQAIQEAQAAGLPVIAPAMGGPLTLIEHNSTGILVDPTEPDAYRHAVSRLLNDPELATRLGNGARAKVMDNSWSQNNSKLISYYERLLGS
jgi:phosphatidylinositol alpha 1,6-mannosyltransferase